MNLFDPTTWFRKTAPAVAPRSRTVTASQSKYSLGNLRNNRWVTVEGKIGIVTSLGPELSTVDFTDEEGNTTHTLRVPTGLLALAKWRQIPAARLVGRTEKDAAVLGYPLN
jgi:hypothetical protein